MRCALAHAVLVVAGCGSEQTFVYDDAGSMCVFGDDDPQGDGAFLYRADMPVYVRFALQGVCLSSSCTIDRDATCSVTVDGSIPRVVTQASFTEKRDGGDCTADCLLLSATCVSAPLPAGTYTITYGNQSRPLTIPSQVVAPCLKS